MKTMKKLIQFAENREFYVGDIVRFEVQTDKFWDVEVLEVKREYGRVRYKVKAVGGGDPVVTERVFQKV